MHNMLNYNIVKLCTLIDPSTMHVVVVELIYNLLTIQVFVFKISLVVHIPTCMCWSRIVLYCIMQNIFQMPSMSSSTYWCRRELSGHGGELSGHGGELSRYRGELSDQQRSGGQRCAITGQARRPKCTPRHRWRSRTDSRDSRQWRPR
jgi:hypothetical protein